jgi:hypothetical protein
MRHALACAALGALTLTGCAQALDYAATHDGGPIPGNCASYAPLLAAHSLPVATFTAIMRRESGCDPNRWVVDRDDDGGAGFGLNYRGSMAGYWPALCGMTKSQARLGNANIDQIIGCVAAEYHAHGLAAWR